MEVGADVVQVQDLDRDGCPVVVTPEEILSAGGLCFEHGLDFPKESCADSSEGEVVLVSWPQWLVEAAEGSLPGTVDEPEGGSSLAEGGEEFLDLLVGVFVEEQGGQVLEDGGDSEGSCSGGARERESSDEVMGWPGD